MSSQNENQKDSSSSGVSNKGVLTENWWNYNFVDDEMNNSNHVVKICY